MAGFWSMFNTAPAAGPTNVRPQQQPIGSGFPNNNQQNQQTNQQNQPGNRPTNGATVPDNNNGNQGNGNDPNSNQQQNVNPLDTYSKIFDTKNPTGDAPPTFSIDP